MGEGSGPGLRAIGPDVWSVRRLPAALAALALVASPAVAGEPGYEVAPATLDCRYPAAAPAAEQPAAETPGPTASTFLPGNDVFRPLLADPREPRFSAAYRRLHFRGADLAAEGEGRTIDLGLIGLGGTFGLWGLRQPRGCDGLQLSVFGTIFSQFNLDAASADLLNTDYLVGPQVTLRRGRWSGRLRLYHQSSHLGDEFLLNFGLEAGVRRQDLSFEAVDALASVEGRWWRLYGGGGAVVDSGPDPDLTDDPGFVWWGLELRGPGWRPWAWLGSTRFQPVFGANFVSVQAVSWNVTTSLNGGLEWSSPGGAHRIRLLLAYRRGNIPFSQFFEEKTENFGVELQFEF
jgi:hypothetical protein